MQFTLHDKLTKRIGTINNALPDSLKMYDSSWHRYADKGSATFDFTISKRRNGKLLDNLGWLAEGNHISFRYKNRIHQFKLMHVLHSRDEIKIESETSNLELLNEYSPAYAATKTMSFDEYIVSLDLLKETNLKINTNEISTLTRTLEWTSEDTKLSRLLSLVTNFNAECEFTVEQNRDGTLKNIVMDVYKENDGELVQGVGTNRTDIILYVPHDADITMDVDMTNMFNATKVTGKDGLYIKSIANSVLSNGTPKEEEYFIRSGASIYYAPLSARSYPASVGTGDIYTRRDFETEYTKEADLAAYALKQLKLYSQPIVTYGFDGGSGIDWQKYDLEVGDTVKISNVDFDKDGMLLTARVSEIEVCFEDRTKDSIIFNSFKRLQSKLSANALTLMAQEIEKRLPYSVILSSNNGTMLKKDGNTTLQSKIFKGSSINDTIKADTYNWTLEGVTLSTVDTCVVNYDDLKNEANNIKLIATLNDIEIINTEVALTKVIDGSIGEKGDTGDKGDAGKPSYLHIGYAYSADGSDRFSSVYPNINLISGTSKTSRDLKIVNTNAYAVAYLNDATKWGSILNKVVSASIEIDLTNIKVDGRLQFWNSVQGEVVGNTIKAGSKGVSTVTTTLQDVTSGNLAVRIITDTVNTSTFIIPYKNLKLEMGKDSTTWLPSIDEVTIYDYPNYIGTYTDDIETASTNYTSYKWIVFKGGTPVIHEAYAYSVDGKDRFTTTYPKFNELYGTRKFTGTSWSNSLYWYSDGEYKGVDVRWRNATWSGTDNPYIATEDGVYTISAYVKANGVTGSSARRYIWVNDVSVTGTNYDLGYSFDWIRDSYTVSNIKKGDVIRFRYENSVTSASNRLVIGGYKIEKGAIATPWMPAASEVLPTDYPNYVGTYTDFNGTDSTDPSAYTWKLATPNAIVEHSAYAYSADGSVGFTTRYPNLNILKGTKVTDTASITTNWAAMNGSKLAVAEKNGISVTVPGGTVSTQFGVGKNIATVTPGTTITVSMYVKNTGTVAIDNFYIQLGLYSSTTTIYPNSGKTNIPLDDEYHLQTLTYAIPSDVTSIKVWAVDVATVANSQHSFNVYGVKAEYGYYKTSWMPSADEVITSDYPTYKGVYSDFLQESSNNYLSYSWGRVKGFDGIDGITTMLTNESHTFAGSTTSAIASNVTTTVMAFAGSISKTVSIGTIIGLPTGMTATIVNNNATNPTITFTVTTAMVTKSGTVTIPITVDGVSITKVFSYGIALQGSPGAGSVAINMTSEGYVFQGTDKNANAASTTTEVTAAQGTTDLSVKINSITGLPTGMTATISGNDTTKATITISVTTSLVSLSGNFLISVTTGGVTIIKSFNYALALQGVQGIDGLTTYVHKAYAYNDEGTDRFSSLYPNINLLANSKRYNTASPKIVTSSKTDGAVLVSDVYVSLTAGSYTLNGQTDGTWAEHSSTTDPTKKAVSLWLVSTTPGLNVNLCLGSKVPQTINIQNDGDYAIRVNTYSDGTTSVTRKFWDFKLEKGNVATPWVPSATEAKPNDFPNYFGQYSDFTSTDSTDPTKYKWMLIRGKDMNGFTAFSYSSDGSDRFSKLYPKDNLLSNTKYLSDTQVAGNLITSPIVTTSADTTIKTGGVLDSMYASLTKRTVVTSTDWFRAFLIGTSAYPNMSAYGSIKPNTKYTFSAYIRGSGNHVLYAYNNWVSTGTTGGVLTYDIKPTSTTSWQFISFTVTSAATIPTDNCQFFIRTGEIDAQLDICLAKIEENGSASLWLPTPYEGQASDYPVYIGTSDSDSANYADYTWQLYSDWVLRATNEILDSKADQADLDNVSDIANSANVLAQNSVSQDVFESWLSEEYKDTVQQIQKVNETTISDLNKVASRTSAMESTWGAMKVKWDFINQSFTFSDEGMIISNPNSHMAIQVSSDKIAFIDNDKVVAFINGEVLNINKGVFLDSAMIGNHQITKFSDTSPVTIITYIGGK